MNITIIDGHPDPSEGRLSHALAARYARAVEDAGDNVRRIDIAKLDFGLVRDPRDFYEGRPNEAIAAAQDDIKWADHIVFFFPLWMSDMPALLKAFLEQTFRPGFALDYGGRFGLPKKLLGGKSARIVVTMGMPAFFYRTAMGAHMVKMVSRLLKFAGIGPVAETVIGSADAHASEKCKRGWFETIDRAARADMSRRPHRVAALARLAVAGAAVAGAAYIGYVLTSWSRYGATRTGPESDVLLDRYLPNFEVGLQHATLVHAPASVTFSSIRLSDFERSPIVRGLLGMRDAIMRNKAPEEPKSGLPLERLTTIGWGVLAVDAGKEIVLGTVTKPWQSNSKFRPIRSDEFLGFDEPGYAKIALSIRVDEVSSEHCELRTETRVQTTDPISRARFRRYWAFLSPGMALIRRILIQQIKADAEDTWERSRPLTGTSM